MDRRTLDLAVPMVYGALLACSALWFKDALVPIAVVGAMLTGLYWAALRQKLPAQNPPRGTGTQDAPPPRHDDPPYGSA
ncbi:hypothetical protein JOE63_000053 [Cellulosimicrobium cellulans]|jgi:hypothetical protein|uniref:Uncharacterized protein n=1 Tax=Cellulosimicrobium cellulans TaxID=1710 RepID=A0A1Y0HSQ1_CELCE|nr:hypothetical protein [Cellulosimicrobium cellulans]ARU51192.1 hypothetical protein CBR64_06480 [Cellulosimicrobium cellulans]MBM7817576.1 hypothetical protein [Cellulosimicrobium cellulans]